MVHRDVVVQQQVGGTAIPLTNKPFTRTLRDAAAQLQLTFSLGNKIARAQFPIVVGAGGRLSVAPVVTTGWLSTSREMRRWTKGHERVQCGASVDQVA
jgi:hypothetical protein